MREVRENMTFLDCKDRIKSDSPDIVEKVWIINLENTCGVILYSGCYIQKWYHICPRLRLMTTDGVVEIKRNVIK